MLTVNTRAQGGNVDGGLRKEGSWWGRHWKIQWNGVNYSPSSLKLNHGKPHGIMCRGAASFSSKADSEASESFGVVDWLLSMYLPVSLLPLRHAHIFASPLHSCKAGVSLVASALDLRGVRIRGDDFGPTPGNANCVSENRISGVVITRVQWGDEREGVSYTQRKYNPRAYPLSFIYLRTFTPSNL